MKYNDWLKEWLESYVRPSSKMKTYERYSEVVNGHLSKIGCYEINELTPLILQRFTAELLKSGNMKNGRGLSANSVNGIVTIIQNSLREAYNIGLATQYTADKIKRPKIKEKKVLCFSVEEQRKIEYTAMNTGKPKFFGIILCLYTGLRIGELLALKWDDIDFKNEEVFVSKTCHDGKDALGKFVRITESPKTAASQRLIPLPKQLLPMLKELKKKSRSDYVISNGDCPIATRCYQRSFEVMLKALNIERKGFHALRHTFATRALECGMDVKTLSEILGHKNAAVTLNRYVHSLIEHKRDMMNKLGRLINFNSVCQNSCI